MVWSLGPLPMVWLHEMVLALSRWLKFQIKMAAAVRDKHIPTLIFNDEIEPIKHRFRKMTMYNRNINLTHTPETAWTSQNHTKQIKMQHEMWRLCICSLSCQQTMPICQLKPLANQLFCGRLLIPRICTSAGARHRRQLAESVHWLYSRLGVRVLHKQHLHVLLWERQTRRSPCVSRHGPW